MKPSCSRIASFLIAAFATGLFQTPATQAKEEPPRKANSSASNATSHAKSNSKPASKTATAGKANANKSSNSKVASSKAVPLPPKYTGPSPVARAIALAPETAENKSLDQTFLSAREAVRRGDRASAAKLGSSLENHELALYVTYWRLSQTLAESSDFAAVQAFLASHEGDYLAERLRAQWLKELAKRGQWEMVTQEANRLIAPEPESQCLALDARLQQGDNGVLPRLRKLWDDPSEANDVCQPLLDRFAQSGQVSTEDIWRRAHLQMELNRIAGARHTLAFLPDEASPDRRQLEQAIERPPIWAGQLTSSQLQSPAQRQLLPLALQRIARNDPQQAADILRTWEGHLNRDERARAWSPIALQAAKRLMPEAREWYKATTAHVLSDENAAWKVRTALRAQDWNMVRDTIEGMPSELASRPEWVYWLGRAYKAQGRTRDAENLFNRIAGQTHFYGNLADEELGRRISVPPLARAPSPEELRSIGQREGIRRALAWFRMDQRTEGVKEWNWALRGMSDRELLSAAHLARQFGIYDRAIMAADKTRQEHDFSLRYLAPFSEEVRSISKEQSVDDAWVYGLMRQESRFITSARSNVGASGLMQLMPATARWVANKLGLKNFSQSKVTDTSTNLLLGTTYMRLVLENLDNHPVLASAAYNAGPGRARKWRADTPLEGAIYAESIPFAETRDYVKKVMSNAVYYAALFNGRSESLRERLGIIPANNGNTVLKDPDLP